MHKLSGLILAALSLLVMAATARAGGPREEHLKDSMDREYYLYFAGES